MARVDYENYTLHVKVMLRSKLVFDDLREVLIKMVPANMVIDLVYSLPVTGAATIYTSIKPRYTHKKITKEVALYGVG